MNTEDVSESGVRRTYGQQRELTGGGKLQNEDLHNLYSLRITFISKENEIGGKI
jgi:hypothetical protein